MAEFTMSDEEEYAEPSWFTMAIASVPVANFSAEPLSGYPPLTIQFSDLSTEYPYSWLWDFGDGEISEEQNPSHTYEEAGTYTVTLIATNEAGSDTETKIGYITVLLFQANFSAQPLTGKYPLTVHFTDLSIAELGIDSWLWDFGDSGSTEQNSIHTYSRAGSFTVKLTISSGLATNTETKGNYISAVERSTIGMRTEDKIRHLSVVRILPPVRVLDAKRDPSCTRIL